MSIVVRLFRDVLEAININERKIYTQVRKLRMTIDELNIKLAEQAKAIEALSARIPVLPPPVDLKPIGDAIDANTARINSLVPPATPFPA